jgi:glucosamine-phosphate N-acetyltransferase
MSLQIIEYSSNYYFELFKILKDNYNTNITQHELECNYVTDNKSIYLALLDKKIVGCAFLEIKNDYVRLYKYGFISYVAVDIEYRHRGIGKKLIETLIHISKNIGCTAVELTSANYRLNAHKFYETLGFTKKKTSVFIKELCS